MCFKGSDMYPVTAKAETKPLVPKVLDKDGFENVKKRLRAKTTSPADMLKELGIVEASIMRTQSLNSFLEHCEDNEADPIGCFIEVLKFYMTDHGQLKENEPAAIKTRKDTAVSLEEQLEAAKIRGNKDEIIKLAFALIEDLKEDNKCLQRKVFMA